MEDADIVKVQIAAEQVNAIIGDPGVFNPDLLLGRGANRFP